MVQNGLWKGAGGNTIEPAAKFGDGELCGLSQSSRKLWCVNTSTNKWTNHGGYWRKLDDDRTIGIGGGWDVEFSMVKRTPATTTRITSPPVSAARSTKWHGPTPRISWSESGRTIAPGISGLSGRATGPGRRSEPVLPPTSEVASEPRPCDRQHLHEPGGVTQRLHSLQRRAGTCAGSLSINTQTIEEACR